TQCFFEALTHDGESRQKSFEQTRGQCALRFFAHWFFQQSGGEHQRLKEWRRLSYGLCWFRHLVRGRNVLLCLLEGAVLELAFAVGLPECEANLLMATQRKEVQPNLSRLIRRLNGFAFH